MLDIQEIIQKIQSWFLSHGVKIAAIVIVAYILRRISGAFIKKIISRVIVSDHFLSKEAADKRRNTLIHIFAASAGTLIWLLAGMLLLREIGIDIGPLLAAAGIAGLAFGFGGQYLVRDIIAGLLLILENQYRVGDIVCFGEKICGKVEDISLRITTLRDLDGTVHHIPHGEIKLVSNLSKYYARVNLNIRVAYESDLEKVIAVVNRVGRELSEDPQWKEAIIKPPQFLRVEDFVDSAIIIKILGETKAHKHWDVAGEFRKRLKIAFDKEGIKIC